MAVTQNTYTGNGSTVLYSFTFPYLETTDIKVSLNGTVTTAYTLANATTIQFNAAPANGAAIRIYRETDDSALAAQFYPGSAIRSSDLNDNFTQNLYVTQESSNNAATATSTANTALTNSNTAISTANTALSTANTASTNASAAVTTANTASTNASAAVSTANTASTNATTAVNTANSAASDAATALSTANTALSTANTASTNASAAVSTANTASTNASAAVSTANTASTNASSAVSTANTASSNASTALSTANTAISTANAAASAVANAILYDTVANVAAIPASPANNDAVEVVNSTGIESFTPLSGIPSGFVGDSGLSVRIVYTTTGATWNWIQYFPNDPETRYGDAITTLQTDLNTAEADILALDSAKLDATTAASTYQTQAGMSSYLTTTAAGTTYAPLASPTFTGTATAPSVTVTGNTVPTNGVYLPAANSVALSTNGTGRLFVDASGRIGVGTNPATLLHISSATGTATPTPTELRIATTSNGTDWSTTSPWGRLSFYSADASNSGPKTHATIDTIAQGNAGGHSALRFAIADLTTTLYEGMRFECTGSSGQTFTSFSTSGSERLRITSAGLVGVGTSAPAAPLHVAASNNTTLRLEDTTGSYCDFNYNDSGTASALVISADAGNTGADTHIRFNIDNSERLRITSAGLVGVGTSSPVARLTVSGNAVGVISALTDGATITPDFSLANNFSVTLGGNRTLANPSNLTAGQAGTIVITQDGTGSRTLAFGSNWKFPGGTAPTLTTTASAVDVIAYYVESATRITARLIADVK